MDLRLTCLAQQINDYSMVAFVPMNINNEESIETVLLHVDHAINFGEDVEPRVRPGCGVVEVMVQKHRAHTCVRMLQEPKDLDMDE